MPLSPALEYGAAQLIAAWHGLPHLQLPAGAKPTRSRRRKSVEKLRSRRREPADGSSGWAESAVLRRRLRGSPGLQPTVVAERKMHTASRSEAWNRRGIDSSVAARRAGLGCTPPVGSNPRLPSAHRSAVPSSRCSVAAAVRRRSWRILRISPPAYAGGYGFLGRLTPAATRGRGLQGGNRWLARWRLFTGPWGRWSGCDRSSAGAST